MTAPEPQVQWTDAGGETRRARWVSDNARPAPEKLVLADDRMPADAAFRLIKEGAGLLWTGDYHNARHLIQALERRLARGSKHKRTNSALPSGANRSAQESLKAAFLTQRRELAQRASVLGMVLLHMSPDHRLDLRRAPDVRQACQEALGHRAEPYVMPLRHLLGIVGAHEWRKAGVAIPALGGQRIHAHYGVFSPVRGEYLDLVARAPLPEACTQPGGVAWDIGTGTGVLAAILSQRGVHSIVATDLSERAINCARDNLTRLDMGDRVTLRQTHMFPNEGLADLIVCNPPWLPGTPASVLEQAIYDPDSDMLRTFLRGLPQRLSADGEGWLILSDLAERLQLRSQDWLLNEIRDAGLLVKDRLDTRPTHQRSRDNTDPVHQARSSEVTSLWRLVRATL